MTDETYNGWTNHETWNVHLWLTSDTAEVDETAREAAREIGTLGLHPDEFRDHVEAYIFGDEAQATLGTDLIGGALSRVNWRELVEALAVE